MAKTVELLEVKIVSVLPTGGVDNRAASPNAPQDISVIKTFLERRAFEHFVVTPLLVTGVHVMSPECVFVSVSSGVKGLSVGLGQMEDLQKDLHEAGCTRAVVIPNDLVIHTV